MSQPAPEPVQSSLNDGGMAAAIQMLSQLNLGVYAAIASGHANESNEALRGYLTNQLMKDLAKLGYSAEQQKSANVPAVVDLITKYISQ